MKKKRMMKRLPLALIILINIALVISVLLLMNHVKSLLYSDVKINLQEIVTQNKDVISSKFAVELNNLQLITTQITDRMSREPDKSQEKMDQIFLDYLSEKGDHTIFMADTTGRAIFSNGEEVNIAGRNYFKLALAGSQNVSDRIISRLDGADIFVISVPIVYNKKIVGTIQRQYTPEEMYHLCELSLFSDQGNLNIINSDGYILISSQNKEYSRESDNYFRILYSKGNNEATRRLEQDIQQNHSGFFEISIDGEQYFSAYTPLDMFHDWYLITSIATGAVSPNSNIVITMFYIILLLIVVISGSSMVGFLFYKNRQQMNLEKIAFTDPVTGGDTLNRFQMDMNVILQNKAEEDFSILVFDLDNFKYINGFYGFEFGDLLLKDINESVRKLLLPDERVARISGDHFVALLIDANRERIETILDKISEPEGIKVYISAGLYHIKDRTQSTNLMIDKATTASREVKNIQNQRLGFYSEEHEKQLVQNEQMKRAIEAALAEGEIIPFFQPKVDINTGEIVGAEALARWRKADGTLIPPFHFIPICEQSGLVVEVDFAIFRHVLAYLRNRLDANKRCVKISVNFSRLHLLNNNFLVTILTLLKEYKIPHKFIELELTESIIFNNPDTIQSFLSEIHSFGLSVSMDDFGSGHSSLGMLKNLDVDVLKIDREFLIHTDNSDKQKIIFGAVANMANQLNMTIVVEGVETEQQIDLMKENGCMIAQGYYYSKPVAEEEFSLMCEKRYMH